jgi:plasmid rolling circle replication initiator protein Rep
MNRSNQPYLVEGYFNTLVQPETDKAIQSSKKVVVNGRGSDLLNEKAIKGRAKKKLTTQKIVSSLIDVAKKKGATERVESYWNTFYCQNKIYSSNDRLYGQYCKNRFCTLCLGIRKADIINRYLPTISEWSDPHFVTITAKAVKARSLGKRMRDMNRGFQIISARCRKRAQRGWGIKLIGVKSLECNFNPVTGTYNPHIHLIVATKKMAEIIIKEWLELCTSKFALRWAQNMQKIKNTEKALIEIVKYGCKLFTEPAAGDAIGESRNHDIYAASLDNIFAAMKGIRLFERFGFDLPKVAKVAKATTLHTYDIWEYDPEQFDWVGNVNHNILSGYVPPLRLLNLLQWNIDTELE